MTRWATPVWLAVIVAGAGAASGAGQTPSVQLAQQFQEAVTLMEARGNCRAALPLLGRVADGADRGLAARALVYVGTCQERLGREEATRAYRRVIGRP